jgi:hypothetical protein
MPSDAWNGSVHPPWISPVTVPRSSCCDWPGPSMFVRSGPPSNTRVVVLVPGVGDLQHDVGATIDDERSRRDVEVLELDRDHLGAATRCSLTHVGVGAVERVRDPDGCQDKQDGSADDRRHEQKSPASWASRPSSIAASSAKFGTLFHDRLLK